MDITILKMIFFLFKKGKIEKELVEILLLGIIAQVEKK